MQASEINPAQSAPTSVAAQRVVLTKVTSFLVMTQQRRAVYTGTVDRLESEARSVRNHNLAFGWWGVPFGLLWTPLALWRNAQAMQQIRSAAASNPIS